MLIQKIKIRGAIGIKKGLGLDEIEIDFENKTGLIALSGPNGRAKTTILELMAPYRTFASRKGALRHHFFLRDSIIERWYLFNGNKYHTVQKIDSGSDRSEAFIYLNNAEKSETNGKNTEYDNYIIDLFGSQVLFYNSVFCAQGSDNFADMTTGEIKGLFVEFLRLDRLAAYEEQSKKAIRFYDEKKAVLDNEIYNIKVNIEKLSDLDFKTVKLIASNDRVDEDIKNNTLLIDEAQEKLEDLKKTKITNQINIDKVKELDEQVKKLELDQAQIKRDRIAAEDIHSLSILEIAQERQKLFPIINQKELIEKASGNLEFAKERDLHFSRIFEKILEDLATIDKELKVFDSDHLKPLREQKETLKNDEALLKLTGQAELIKLKLRQAKEKESSLLAGKRNAENDIELAGFKKDVEICKEKIAMSIDPECKSTTCPALESIKDAKKHLLVLEFSFSSKQNEVDVSIKEFETGIKTAEAFVSKYKADSLVINTDKAEREIFVQEQLDKINNEIEGVDQLVKEHTSRYLKIDSTKVFNRDSRDSYRKRIKEAEAMAGKLADLKIAESKKARLDLQENEKIEAWLETKGNFNSAFELKIKEIAKLNDETLLIDEKINLDVDQDIEVSSQFVEDKNQESKELEEIRSQNNEALAVIKNELLKKEEAEKELEIKQDIKSKLEKELTDWTYLKISCSKTGLQALEIDGAAPLITKEANSLLEMTFGLDFQIKIVTQDPESGKEVFWVMVIRGDGAEDKFENLSGGQKVWIAKALSLGMTLISKQKSGKAFATLFADEEDGALDREKAIDFIGLYRSMMQAGAFESCMYISHNPDVVAMADKVLDFSGDSLVWR